MISNTLSCFRICKKKEKPGRPMKIDICYFTWHVVIVLSHGKESLMTGKHLTGKLTTRQEKMDARAPGGAGVEKKKKKGLTEFVLKGFRSRVNISSIKCAQTELRLCTWHNKHTTVSWRRCWGTYTYTAVWFKNKAAEYKVLCTSLVAWRQKRITMRATIHAKLLLNIHTHI